MAVAGNCDEGFLMYFLMHETSYLERIASGDIVAKPYCKEGLMFQERPKWRM